MTNLESILKSRDTTLPAKVCIVKAIVFPVVMYGCESQTIKKAECQRIDAFELWCWRRLLRVPWTARRSNQSILKEISPEYSLEGLMLKLKTPILWPPDAKNWLIWKDSDAGKDWRQEEKGMTEDEMVGWHHWLDGHEFEQTGQPSLACCNPWCCKESDMIGWLNWTPEKKKKTLMLGKTEDRRRRRRGWQKMKRLDGITDSRDMSLRKLWEIVKDRKYCSPWGHKESDTT